MPGSYVNNEFRSREYDPFPNYIRAFVLRFNTHSLTIIGCINWQQRPWLIYAGWSKSVHFAYGRRDGFLSCCRYVFYDASKLRHSSKKRAIPCMHEQAYRWACAFAQSGQGLFSTCIFYNYSSFSWRTANALIRLRVSVPLLFASALRPFFVFSRGSLFDHATSQLAILSNEIYEEKSLKAPYFSKIDIFFSFFLPKKGLINW